MDPSHGPGRAPARGDHPRSARAARHRPQDGPQPIERGRPHRAPAGRSRSGGGSHLVGAEPDGRHAGRRRCGGVASRRGSPARTGRLRPLPTFWRSRSSRRAIQSSPTSSSTRSRRWRSRTGRPYGASRPPASPARLADLGSVCEPDRVLQALDDARRRRLSTAWIRDTAERLHRPGQRGTGTVLALLDEVEAEGSGPDSWFERLVERCLASAELPALHRQYDVRDRGRLASSGGSTRRSRRSSSDRGPQPARIHDGRRPRPPTRAATCDWPPRGGRCLRPLAPPASTRPPPRRRRPSRIPTKSCLRSQEPAHTAGLPTRARRRQWQANSCLTSQNALTGQDFRGDGRGRWQWRANSCLRSQKAAHSGRNSLGASSDLRRAGGSEHPFAGIGWTSCRRSRSSPTSRPRATSPRPSRQLADGHRAGRPVPDAARHHRRRARAPPSPGPSSRCSGPRWSSRPTSSLAAQLANEFREFFPAEPGRVLRQLLRLLPARGLHRRRATPTSRRTARSTTRSTGCATRPPSALLTRRDVIVVAQRRCIYGLGSPEEYRGQLARAAHRRSTTTSAPSCASSSTCSTSATT